MISVHTWMKESGRKGKVAYIFEAGHKHQRRANFVLTEAFGVPAVREHFRYAGHAFVRKEDAPACQAADLLAWQWFTERKRIAKGEPTRKDLASLLELLHLADHTTGHIALGVIAAERGEIQWSDIDPLVDPIVIAIPRSPK